MDLDLTSDFLGVTEFRSVIRESLERVEQTRRPLILTRGGKPSAVLLDVDSYQTLCDALKQTETGVAIGEAHSHEGTIQELDQKRQRRKDQTRTTKSQA